MNNLISKYGYKNIRANMPQNTNIQKSSAETFIPSQSTTNTANSSPAATTSPQIGSLAGEEKSAFVKDLLKLPKNLNEFVYMVQHGLNQAQLNKLITQQSALHRTNLISPSQAQILAQLQGLSTEELSAALKTQLLNSTANSNLKTLQILQSGMVSLADFSALLQANGKDAIAKLIIAMGNASKQGVTDLSQLKDTAKLINASIALASQENSNQTLKTLILLYLPWLPLQEGTDFDIEITQNSENQDNDSILVITINTVNFGKVIATLILETSNSVHVNIECSDKFPKDELLLRIKTEEKHYASQSVISFQSIETKSEETPKASVTTSSMSEINPYMLLMSHSIIRNTIMIDNETSNGLNQPQI